jgi:hypothetical protein
MTKTQLLLWLSLLLPNLAWSATGDSFNVPFPPESSFNFNISYPYFVPSPHPPLIANAEYDVATQIVSIRNVQVLTLNYQVQLQSIGNNLFVLLNNYKLLDKCCGYGWSSGYVQYHVFNFTAQYNVFGSRLVIPTLLVMGRLYEANLTYIGNFTFHLDSIVEFEPSLCPCIWG